VDGQFQVAKKSLHMSQEDLEKLKNTIEAYDKLSELSHKELLEAHQELQARESQQELSREELIRLHEQVRGLENEKASLETRIRSVLHEDKANEARILSELDALRQESDAGFFVNLFRVLCHHEFEPDAAMTHWADILKHSAEMQAKLGRPIGFRVAMMDYFINLNRVLKSPVILEIALYDEMMQNALMDELTGVYNRRYFERSLNREINRARRHSHSLSLLALDLDNFKEFNDRHGHAAGDQVLAAFSDQLRKSFRAEDIVCRYGGEEFVVILPLTTPVNAMIVAQRFLDEVRKLEIYGRSVTCSGGIAGYPEHESEPRGLFKAADRALFIAKKRGKDRILFADEVI